MKIIEKIKKFIIRDKEYIKFSVGLFVLFALGFFIAFLFKKSEYGYELKINDYLTFTGAFAGVFLTAFNSLMILKITLEKQKKQFDEQREIDDKRRKEDKEQLLEKINFEKEKYTKTLEKEKIIRDLSNYKDLYYEITETLDKALYIRAKLQHDNIYEVNDQIKDISNFVKNRDRIVINGRFFENKDYSEFEEELIKKFNELFEYTRISQLNRLDIIEKIDEIGNILRRQSKIILNLTEELNKELNKI